MHLVNLSSSDFLMSWGGLWRVEQIVEGLVELATLDVGV